MESDGSRGEVLEALFAGVDLIAQSEHGKTFNAFWRLLTDGEQAATLMDSLESVTSRTFARSLELKERRFLQNLTGKSVTLREVIARVPAPILAPLSNLLLNLKDVQSHLMRPDFESEA